MATEEPTIPDPGTDTATGTDPAAKYDRPGYEDKSFGQAVDQDQQLADDLLAAADGDLDRAEERFREESAGAPALARQAENGDDEHDIERPLTDHLIRDAHVTTPRISGLGFHRHSIPGNHPS